MKKNTLIMTMLVLAALQAWGNPVSENSARSIAWDFINDWSGCGTQSTKPSGWEAQLVHTEVSSVDVTLNAYYIINTGNGFIIVAGDDRAQRVLAYGDRDIDMTDIPDAMQFMLDSYKEQIDYLLSNPNLVVQAPRFSATMSLATPVEPMLTTTWNQWAPYNLFCPTSDGKTCPTGCAATALSQVMYYWKHPVGEVAGIPGYTTATLKIEIEDLPPTTFDWDNMKASYKDGYTTQEGEAVATLMRYVGQAELMNYKPSGSSANVAMINRAAQRLGYSPQSQVIYKVNRTEEQWIELLQGEIGAHRPVIYTSRDSIKKATHAYVIDGWDGEKYHINWGWGGQGDGYYALYAFNVASYQFNSGHIMIAGLKPASPAIAVDPESLSFDTEVGEVQQETFIVTGTDLSGDLTLALDDPSGCYSIDKTAITSQAATAGDTVTVTYSPTVDGESLASVIISGGGAEAQTIALSGTATTPASISVSESVLSFGTSHTNGNGVTRTLTITGTNLTDDIQLSMAGDNASAFTALTATITPDEAAAGATVTLRFKPTSSGVNQARLEIKSNGVETVTIPLVGIGTRTHESLDGYLTAYPNNLSFETQVGTPVTMTFKVHYTPNGGDAIMMSSPNADGGNGNEDTESDAGVSPKRSILQPITNSRYTLKSNFTIVAERDSLLKRIDLPSFPDPIILPYFRLTTNVTAVGDSCFSITPDHMSQSLLNNGATVTVTYNPTCVGNHKVYLAISMPAVTYHRAKPILVEINGTATPPTTLNAPRSGDISIADVTRLIDLLLSDAPLPADADEDSDGQVNISDVTHLVDRLVGKQ